MAERICNEVEECDRSPLMVALVGTPGSGKGVSAFLLANALDEAGINCMVMPHDGYHYPLEHLKIFPDAEDAIYRRGAPDTFDPQALLRDLSRIRDGDEELIMLPAFDHAKGDPEPDRHIFDRNQHKVVLCEGLYLLHDQDGWEDVASVFDLTLFMNSDVDACIERVKVRNQVIPGYTPEEIAIRCEKVDRANAMTVMRSKTRADVVVESVTMAMPQSAPSAAVPKMTQVLSALSLKDIDAVDGSNAVSDWAFDITSRAARPHGVSIYSHSQAAAVESRARTESIVSDISEPAPVSALVGRWEPEVAQRIQKSAEEATRLPYMVALVGAPGSGKTVSSFLLASALEEAGIHTMVMPHDGYHFALEHLKTFPDADDAIYRRGAPDTFDPQALLRDLTRIRDGEEELIMLPAFDHSRGDPEPDTHVFDRSKHKVVLCEGLYLLHDQDGWEDIASVFDLTIFLDSDVDACIERVKVRNTCIPGYTAEEIAIRCEKVDRVNAMSVMRSKPRADLVVQSAA